jgi:hypothetical protein
LVVVPGAMATGMSLPTSGSTQATVAKQLLRACLQRPGAGQYSLGVHQPGDRFLRSSDAAGISDRDDWPEHCLAGDARPVRALAPDQLPLHRRDAQPGRAGTFGSGYADGPPRQLPAEGSCNPVRSAPEAGAIEWIDAL